MICVKCKKEIPENSLFCNHCGKKQKAVKSGKHNRSHGTGTIKHDKRYKNEWIAYTPANRLGNGRKYIGSFSTRKEAQMALEKFMQKERPDLYNCTLAEIYNLWGNVHFRQVSQSAISLYSSMWKRFAPIQDMKVRELRSNHFQQIIDTGKSKSACDTIKIIAVMLCKYAMENDIVDKNYAEFTKIPKFEKKEKRIFTPEEISILWANSEDEVVRIILLMIYTGLRIGEVTSLKVADVHLNDGYMVGGEKTESGKNRIIPIPEGIPELKKFLADMVAKSKSDTIITDNVQKLRRNFYTALDKCKIQSKNGEKLLTPHSTRHTFASISSRAGIRPENLQKIIGHSDFHTTAEIYIHQNIDTLKQEMNKIRK